MVNIDKIKSLAKERGIKLGYLTSQLGLTHTYFADVKKNGKDIPDDRLDIIADILDTTCDYLRDKSDVKQRSPEDIPEDEKRLRELLSQMSEEQLQTALKIISAIAEEKNDKYS